MCPIFLCGLLEFSQFFDGICLPSSRLLTTCVCPISRMCPNFQIGHICIKRSSNRTHVDVSCSSSEYPYEICTHVVNTLDPASATSRLQSLRAILLSLATPHPTPPPTPHSHSEPRQTLDTLRRGKVFRMAWGGGGGGLTCVRGVSVCVCGGGGTSLHALLAGRAGGAPLLGPLLTSIVMKSLMNSSLFLRTKLWLFTAHSACTTRHMFMQRGDSKCNLGYQDFYKIPSIG